MKPSYQIKLNGKKIPVYKTPFTKEDYQQILYSNLQEFFIHDQKTGKVNRYNIGEGRLPGSTLFNVKIDFLNALKILGILYAVINLYKINRFGKKVKSKSINGVKKVDDIVKNWEDLMKIKSPKPAHTTHSTTNPSSNAVSTNNGWTIDTVSKPIGE